MSRKKLRLCAAKRLRNSTRARSNYHELEPKNLLTSVGWDGPGQGSAELSYYVGSAPSGVSQAEFESTIEDALQVWSDVIDVEFTQTNQPNQRNSIDFTSRPIDGTNGVLAQAYFPSDVNRGTIAGDVQFDSLDSWEVGNGRGGRATDLMYVAVHEIGHALGLDHEHDDEGAVLAPTVSSHQTFDGLSQADIDAAIELYAPAPVADPVPAAPEPTNENQQPTVTPNSPTDQPTEPVVPTENENDSSDPSNASDNESLSPVDEDDDTTTDSNRDPNEESPTESDPTSDTDNEDSNTNNEDRDEDQSRRRFKRFLKYLIRRFRFSFWSPFSFLRW